MTSGSALRHHALIHQDDADYHANISTFVRTGMEQNQPVLLVLGGQHLKYVENAFHRTPDVVVVDMERLGRNPGRLLSAFDEFINEHPGRSARIFGEPVWPGRSAGAIREAVRHEALINVWLAGQDATVGCGYAARLPAPVLTEAAATHPVLLSGQSNKDYREPAETLARCDTVLTAPVDAQEIVIAEHSLGPIRTLLAGWAGTTGCHRHGVTTSCSR